MKTLTPHQFLRCLSRGNSDMSTDTGTNKAVASLAKRLDKLALLVGGVTEKGPAPSRKGEDCKWDEENDLNSAILSGSGIPIGMDQVYADGYRTAVRNDALLQLEGYTDATSEEPSLLEITRTARQAALRQSSCPVVGDDGDEDEAFEYRGKSSQAKIVPGVPDSRPRPFLGRLKTFIRRWQKYLLQKRDVVRGKSDPRIAEVDCMSNIVFWLNNQETTLRLLIAALDNGDLESARSLVVQVTACHDAAYDAARMRVDGSSMNLTNKPAAELFTRTTPSDLETASMRAPEVLPKASVGMFNSKANASANGAEALPVGTSWLRANE